VYLGYALDVTYPKEVYRGVAGGSFINDVQFLRGEGSVAV